MVLFTFQTGGDTDTNYPSKNDLSSSWGLVKMTAGGNLATCAIMKGLVSLNTYGVNFLFSLEAVILLNYSYLSDDSLKCSGYNPYKNVCLFMLERFNLFSSPGCRLHHYVDQCSHC